jgi:hypothetical protein
MYSPNLMLRALGPYVLVAMLVAAAGGVAYGLGAPAWVAYAAVLLAVLAFLPGAVRWVEREDQP